MFAAVAISSGAHAVLALFISATSSAESSALLVPSKPLQVRLVSSKRVLAGSEVRDVVEQGATREIMLATQVMGAADGPVVSVTSASGLQYNIGEPLTLLLAAPLPHSEIDDRDTSTSPQVEAMVVSQEELDVQPVPIDPVIPIYPYEEGVASAGGLIKLQLVIDEVGRATSVDVIESALPAAFGVSAARAFETVRFQPGLRNGSPVRCRVTMTIQFALTTLAQIPAPKPDANVGLTE